MGEVYLVCDVWDRRRSGMSEGVIAEVSHRAARDERLWPSIGVKTGRGGAVSYHCLEVRTPPHSASEVTLTVGVIGAPYADTLDSLNATMEEPRGTVGTPMGTVALLFLYPRWTAAEPRSWRDTKRWFTSHRRRKPNSHGYIGCWAGLESHSYTGRETAGLY